MTVGRPVDIFDRGPRFRARRYAVRIVSRDGATVIVVSDHADRPSAVFMARILRGVLRVWGAAGTTGDE